MIYLFSKKLYCYSINKQHEFFNPKDGKNYSISENNEYYNEPHYTFFELVRLGYDGLYLDYECNQIEKFAFKIPKPNFIIYHKCRLEIADDLLLSKLLVEI